MDADPKGLLYSRDQASKGTFSIFWVPVYMSDSPLCFHWSTRRILSQYTSQEKLKVLEKLKHRFWSTSRWPQFFYQTQVHSLPCLPIQSVGDHVEFCWIFLNSQSYYKVFSISCYMSLSKLLNGFVKTRPKLAGKAQQAGSWKYSSSVYNAYIH